MQSQYGCHKWASKGRAGGTKAPWILKFSAKKVVFLVSSGKNQISPLLTPLEKFRKNPLVPPSWKKSFRRPWCHALMRNIKIVKKRRWKNYAFLVLASITSAANLTESVTFEESRTKRDSARGVTKGGRGVTIPRATNHNGDAESLRGARKSPNSAVSSSFNTVDLLPKDLRFEHRGAKLASCPGRHLTSLRPWILLITVCQHAIVKPFQLQVLLYYTLTEKKEIMKAAETS